MPAMAGGCLPSQRSPTALTKHKVCFMTFLLAWGFYCLLYQSHFLHPNVECLIFLFYMAVGTLKFLLKHYEPHGIAEEDGS